MSGVFDGRAFRGGLEVDENARRMSNCFHAERQLLHTMAGALPRVADLRVKIILGTHLWEIGQTLRDFSARLAELREHSDYPARPSEKYEAFLMRLDDAPTPMHQIAGMYEVLSPQLIRVYQEYKKDCDALLDEPTVRVLDEAQARHERFRDDLENLLTPLNEDEEARKAVAEWVKPFRAELIELGPLTELPLRRRQTRVWSPVPTLTQFTRPAEFVFGMDHGIDERAIYGGPEEFYFPLDEEFRRHFLHHMVDAELVAAEIMAWNIYEHPEMPLAFHVDMARQVWDEVRHARVQWDYLDALGVTPGEYPVFHGFDLLLVKHPLLERLVLFNRLGEAGAAQRHRRRNRYLRENGQVQIAILFDYLHADEVPHVGNGERWGKYLFKGKGEEFGAYCRRVQDAFRQEYEAAFPRIGGDAVATQV